jgi:medium-chain acyl-[acyl-carrier-protein] hydrolase
MNDRVAPLHLRPAASPWLVRFQPVARPALRLFCFPYAGGSASVFRAWGAALDPRIEAVVLQLPGRGMRLQETPLVDFELLVHLATEAVVAAQTLTEAQS